MEHDLPLITTLAAGFGMALALGFVAERIRIPAIVGYLTAGIIIGPATPGFVADVQIASQLAEIVVGTAWGDFVSIYLAFLNGEDPSPIPQIHRIKDHAALVADESEPPIDGSMSRSHAAPITRGLLS